MAIKQEPESSIFQMLKLDHHHVTRTLQEMKNAPTEQKENMFGLLHGLLTQHMMLEENFFYSELDNFDQLKEHVNASYLEHEEMKEMLRQLMDVEVDSWDWAHALDILERSKNRHVLREEQEIFPLAAELVGEEQLRKIAEVISSEREKMPKPEAATARKRPSPRPRI